jgi:hypothetical protein
VAVDRSGTAHIVWPTLITGDQPEGAIFYASTRDGSHFTPRVRVPTLGSPKPMHPQLIVRADGTLVVGWDELIDGARVAAVRTIAPRGEASPRFGDPVRLATTGGANHPVLASTDGGVLAAWMTGGEDSRVQLRYLRLP